MGGGRDGKGEKGMVCKGKGKDKEMSDVQE
jgi:hypothetical protein